MVVDAEELMKEAPEKQKIEISQFGWYAGTITTEAPGQDAFAYAPPKGFTKVETFATQADEGESAVEKMVGQPAPDFTLMVYDGPGKTKTLSKADLAGKVVMIDFWATWCGPCMIELPEVQKMIEEYAKRDKELLIVALSQDSKPSEPAAVRKLIEETLEKKKIDADGLAGRRDRTRPGRDGGQRLQRRRVADGRHPRRQGGRPVRPRRVQRERPQGLDLGDRHLARRQVDRPARAGRGLETEGGGKGESK